jgi:hypothetical protein
MMRGEILHLNEIAEAVRLLCQGTVRLTADLEESDLATVGSNQLFTAGDAVELLDDVTAPVAAQVDGRSGLEGVRLAEAMAGPLLVSRRARMRLAEPPLDGVRLVAQGGLDFLTTPWVVKLPGIIVQPVSVEQEPGEGTNRSFDQEHRLSVFYVRPQHGGERGSEALVGEVEALCNLLMADSYLGGTAWNSQVTRVVLESERLAEWRDRAAERVDIAQVDVVAHRLEPWEG